MNSKPSWIYAFVGLVAVSCLLASCMTFGNIKDRMTKSFPVDSGGTLAIESDTGSIAVQGADIDSVEVEIYREVRTENEKKAAEILEDFDIQFHHSGNDVAIKAKYKKKGLRRFWNNIGKYLRVKFIISVPSEYNVDLNTKGGSIAVKQLRGEVLAKTSGGSLNFENIRGNISGKTSGGSISIGEVVGRSNIRTSGGSIQIRLADGPVDAHTSGGSITVEEVKGDIKAHTSGGSITVHLSGDIGMDVNAKTSGGRVHADFPISLKGEISKRSLYGEMNGGGPELYLRTSGGSIYLKKY